MKRIKYSSGPDPIEGGLLICIFISIVVGAAMGILWCAGTLAQWIDQLLK